MATAYLFRDRRFMPLFVTQFFGAFNDNFLKFSLLSLVSFKMSYGEGEDAVLANLATALFMLPFFLFSATAGQLMDKFDRAKMIRILKITELILMLLACVAIYFHSVPFLLALLFLMGMQSAFFSPAKYALLPQQLREDELMGGNAYIEAGTYLAILTGTIGGSVLIMQPHGEIFTGLALTVFALAGYAASRLIPAAPGPTPNLRLSANIFMESFAIIGMLRRQKLLWRCILGLSAFWMVGALYMSQLTAFCKNVVGGDETVAASFMVCFSLGIACGALLSNRLLRGVVQATYLPLAALLMAAATFYLYFNSRAVVSDGNLQNLFDSLQSFHYWHMMAPMFIMALGGGLFTVPLNAMLQQAGKPEEMARIIAGNNIVNAIFMAGGTLSAALLMKVFGFSMATIFLLIALFNLVMAIYVMALLPDALVRSLLRSLLTLLYKVEVAGLENFDKAGKRVLLIANHTSLLDGVLIAAFMPEKITFAIDTHQSHKWYVRPLLFLVNAYPLDPTNPMAIKSLIHEVQRDRKVMIFPEGRITVTGGLMKVYDGTGMVAEKSQAMILPIRIDGAQYSVFSYLKGKLNIRLFPRIKMTVMEPRRFQVDDSLCGRERRNAVSQGIYEMMAEMLFKSSSLDENLFVSLKRAARVNGGSYPIAEDPERKPLTYRNLIMKSHILGSMLHCKLKNEKTVGLMLPNSLAAMVGFFALVNRDRVPAMINFTSGPAMIKAACVAAEVKTIVTSRRFIEMGRLEKLEAELRESIRLIYLEDIVRSRSGKFTGFCRWFFGVNPKTRNNDTAAILFTSGSEGTPKAVVLSHRNLQANRVQVTTVVALTPRDKIFNCLPMFHSFGLSMGMLMPVLSGFSTFLYPSPLHYRIIPALIYDTNATVLFGTDTFLASYGRMAHPYDFFSLRFVWGGAEKMRDETRRLWSDKFGLRIFEGYGTTEAAPVVSSNTPMYFKLGTVGRPLPGIECRLEKVDDLAKGGRLFIRGENIMKGYMLSEAPGVLVMPEDGWYDTGDIVDMDAEGYITIVGRAKRFAKIGGEMVSLAAVESALEKLYPGKRHAAASVKGERGEMLALVTEACDADPIAIAKFFRENGLSELWAPKKIVKVKELPLLGSGKTDFSAVKELAQS